MSTNQRSLGLPTGSDYGAFIEVAQVPDMTKGGDKPIYVKLTPGTVEYNIVKHANSEIAQVDPPKVIRLLIKTGYLAFLRSLERSKK